MDTEIQVVVTPWPKYAEDGKSLVWEVEVTEPKKTHKSLHWSPRLGRFVGSWSAMHLRRSAPSAHRHAIDFMMSFCAKSIEKNRGEA